MINEYGKIAVFDSGMGGISFLHLAMKLLPRENFIFYGDLANAPYGEKSREFIEKRASEIFDFFIEQQAKTIV
ncbi:MAG: glutamate racemase, partial [Bacillota bacterium]